MSTLPCIVPSNEQYLGDFLSTKNMGDYKYSYLQWYLPLLSYLESV